jgi:hypothetical protein
MDLQDNNHGKFFGPVQVYMGYVFIAVGIFCAVYSPYVLFFLIPGGFMAFTYTGTVIDFENKKVRPYTSLFGFIRTGKWIEVSRFSGFKIMKSNRRYTSYSLANVQLDINISDIKLLLVNKNGTRKVELNRYRNFEDARKDMDELKRSLMPESVECALQPARQAK